MKNFVDFIVDVAKDSGLADEFGKHLDGSDHGSIASWLKEKGYDVNEDECKKLKENTDNFKTEKVGYYY